MHSTRQMFLHRLCYRDGFFSATFYLWDKMPFCLLPKMPFDVYGQKCPTLSPQLHMQLPPTHPHGAASVFQSQYSSGKKKCAGLHSLGSSSFLSCYILPHSIQFWAFYNIAFHGFETATHIHVWPARLELFIVPAVYGRPFTLHPLHLASGLDKLQSLDFFSVGTVLLEFHSSFFYLNRRGHEKPDKRQGHWRKTTQTEL